MPAFPQLESLLPQLIPLAVTWAELISHHVLVQGTALSSEGLAIARRVGVRRPELVRVLLVDEMPIPDHSMLADAASATGVLGPNTAGLTLGYAVFVVSRHHSVRLISHELRHVAQYEEAGSISSFLPTYLQQVVTHGYDAAPLELDAIAHEVGV